MVLEGIASSILSHFLSKYIDKLNSNDLRMSLFSGTVSLDNLSIKQSALMEHQLPFKVEKGIVNSIKASIPYTRLKSSPCKIEIDGILVLGTVSGKVLIQADSNNVTSTPSDEYGELDAALQDQNVSKSDFTTGIIGSVIDNLQVSITNVHIRLEYNVGNRTMAIGVVIPSIKVFTIDDNGIKVDVNTSKTEIRKKLILQNLSIYIDTSTNMLDGGVRNDSDSFKRVMVDSIRDQNHQFILHEFSFEVLYQHPKATSGPITYGNILSINTSAIDLAIDALQYRCFAELQIEQARFQRRRFYAICGRPDEFPGSSKENASNNLWWQFLNRCSIKKNRPIDFNPQRALIFLKNRKKNLSTLSQILTRPNPKKDEAFLKKLESQYGGDIVILLRMYAKMVTENELRAKKAQEESNQKGIYGLETSELQEIVAHKDSIKNNADTMCVNFQISEFNVSISYNTQTPLAFIQLKPLEGKFVKNKDDILLESLIGEVALINKRSKDQINIVKLRKSELTKGQCILFNMTGNLAKQLMNIDVIAASPVFFVDISLLSDLKVFFSSASDLSLETSAPTAKKKDMSNPQIIGLLETHKTIFLKAHLDSPVIKLPFKKPIEIMLGNIDIQSINPDRKRLLEDTNSWYDEYSLDITGFSILFDNQKLCKPINFSFLLLQSFIRKSEIVMTKIAARISSIDFNIDRGQYLSLLEVPKYLESLTSSPPPAQQIEYEQSHRDSGVNVSAVSNVSIEQASSLSIQFDLIFEQFDIELMNLNQTVGSDIKVAGIKAGVKAVQNTIEGSFMLQYLSIIGCQKEICNFGSKEEAAINLDVSVNGINMAANLHSARPVVTVDINWIKEILDFFKKPPPTPEELRELEEEFRRSLQNQVKKKNLLRKNEQSASISVARTGLFGERKDFNDFQLLRKLASHPIIKLEVSITAPQIILPYQDTPFTANLGLLHLYSLEPIKREPSNILSFYDRFALEVSELEIKFGDAYLLDPFSAKLELHKAFIVRQDVQSLKAFIDIHQLKLQLKHSQFQKLLGVSEMFTQLAPPPSPEEEQIPKLPQKPRLSETSIAYEASIAYENIIMDSENAFSILADLKFETLQVALLNDDDSVHSSFIMSKLNGHFDCFRHNVDARFKIETLKGIAHDEILLSLGEENVASLDCNFVLKDENVNVDVSISKPTVKIDFRWIFQLKEFFKIPKKPKVKGKNPKKAIKSNDDYTQPNVPLKPIKNSTPSKININNDVEERDIVLQSIPKKQIKKIQGKFLITFPSFSIILVKKTQETIVMSAALSEINATINEDQSGFFALSDIQLDIDKRYLMTPFSIKVDLVLEPIFKISLDLPEIVLNLQKTDYRLLLDIAEYIPAVLSTEKKKSKVVEVVNGVDDDDWDYDNNNDSRNEMQVDIEEETKKPLFFDIKIGKLGLDIDDGDKNLFNFHINNIDVRSDTDNNIFVSLSSIICQEHVSSECNDLLRAEQATVVQISESGNIDVSIATDSTIFLKMEAINALLSIFAPGCQILDYQKKKKKKTKAANTIKSQTIPDVKDIQKVKSKTKVINVNCKAFKVLINEESENSQVLTLTLDDLRYQMIGKRQIIKINDISLVVPSNSDLYPSEMMRGGEGDLIVIQIMRKLILIEIHQLFLFANFEAIKRILNIYADNPIQTPQNPDEDENETKKKEEEDEEEEEEDNNDGITNSDYFRHYIPETGKKIDIHLNQSKILVPVLFGVSNEMLEVAIDVEVILTTAIKLKLNSLTASFIQYGGVAHPPVIDRLSFILTQASNAIALSTDPGSIRIAPADIASFNVLIDSVLKMVNSLKILNKPENEDETSSRESLYTDAEKDIKAIESQEQNYNNENDNNNNNNNDNNNNNNDKEEGAPVEDKNEIVTFSASLEINEMIITFNSDRYQTFPLFRFQLRQINVVYGTNKLSKINVIFNSIDYMCIYRMEWKMFVEPFQLNVSLLKNVTPDMEKWMISASVEEPININFGHNVIQLLVMYGKDILKIISSKELYQCDKPKFTVVNKSAEKIKIEYTTPQTMQSSEPVYPVEIDSLASCEFDIGRDDPVYITIGHLCKKVVANLMPYPVFFNHQIVVSQEISTERTLINVSSVLLFQNKTTYVLYLMKQRSSSSYNVLLELKPNQQIPIPTIEGLKSSKFAITTEKNLTNVSHSTFDIKSIKRRPTLLECVFPKQRKYQLVISSKFDLNKCSMNVKIEPNCVIHNQLPVELIIRPAGQSKISRIKDGEKLATTTIDYSHPEFYGHFAIGTFVMQNARTETSQEENDDLNDESQNEENKNLNKSGSDLIISNSSAHMNSMHNAGPIKLSERILVKLKDGKITPIKVTFVTDTFQSIDQSTITHIAVQCTMNPKKPQMHLMFFAPAIVFNRSGFDFMCVNGKDDKMTTMARFAPREEGANPCEDGFLFWSSTEFFKKKEAKRRLPLWLFATEEAEREFLPDEIEDNNNNNNDNNDDKLADFYVTDEFIECTATHIDGTVMVPTSFPGLFVPLHYTTRSAEPYSKSSLVTITSQCRVRNMTDSSFFLQPVIADEPNETPAKDDKDKKSKSKENVGADAEVHNTNEEQELLNRRDHWTFGQLVEVKGGGVTHRVRFASDSLLFALRTARDSPSYTILNFSEPIHTTFAIDERIYEIENQALGVEMLITIKCGLFPQPLNLLNDLELSGPEVSISQKVTEMIQADNNDDDDDKKKKVGHLCVAKPQSATIVAYDTPFGGSDLILHYEGEEIPISLVVVNTPFEHKDIYYEVVTNKNNTKTICISRKPYVHEKINRTIMFSADIPVITVVLLDRINSEIALLTLQKLQFGYYVGELNQVCFKLRAFQLDDLQPSAMLKVVCAGYPDLKEGEDINSRNLITFDASMFPNAPSFTAFKDFIINIDPIILFLDLSFVSDAVVIMQQMFIPKHSKGVLLSKPKPSEPSSLSSIPLTAQNLTVNSCKFTLFVRSISPRPCVYPTLSSYLKAIPEITNGEIVLPSFHFEDCTMNAAYVQKEIVDPLISAAISQGMKMFLNTDIFMRSTGTKSANFAKKGERIMNGELQVLIQIPGSIILQGGEAVTNFASKIAHFATFDSSTSVNRVNTTAKDTLISGVKAFGDGFIDGFAGVVKTPMQMGKENGVGGVFLGIGKGLIGLITKPIAGILDAGVASFAAARKAINGEDNDVIPPIRCAHAMPMIYMPPEFTDRMLVIKDLAQLSFQSSDLSTLYNQWVEMFVIDVKTGIWYGATQEYVFSADPNGNMIAKAPIRKIIRIVLEAKSNVITLVVDEVIIKTIVIYSKNIQQATRFTQLVTSRRVALGIGE